jgi:hypothetical protein
LKAYQQRAAIEEPYELRRHSPALRATLLAAFCQRRMQELTDTLVELKRFRLSSSLPREFCSNG